MTAYPARSSSWGAAAAAPVNNEKPETSTSNFALTRVSVWQTKCVLCHAYRAEAAATFAGSAKGRAAWRNFGVQRATNGRETDFRREGKSRAPLLMLAEAYFRPT